MADSLLIVDDEDSVRKTFEEWLRADFPEVAVVSVGDAASALRIAQEQPLDLAILDWNLNAGTNGLQLLEDLQVFRPELVAILVTGFASQATPLDALRMGVRDYFDKSLDLNRDALHAAVAKQLRLLRPAKREREVNEQLARFQAAAQEALAYVRTSAALPGADALGLAAQRALAFLQNATKAEAAHLVWRSWRENDAPAEQRLRFFANDVAAPEAAPPFGQTLAAAAALQDGGALLVDLSRAAQEWRLELTPVERLHHQALLMPLPVDKAVTAVVELFARPNCCFGPAEQRIAEAAGPVVAELLRLAAGQKETQRLLLEALEAALRTSRLTEGAPAALKSSMQSSLGTSLFQALESPDAVAVTEELKQLAQRHGAAALRRALTLIREVRKLLDEREGLEASA